MTAQPLGGPHLTVRHAPSTSNNHGSRYREPTDAHAVMHELKGLAVPRSS
jgi:hypothetical protein